MSANSMSLKSRVEALLSAARWIPTSEGQLGRMWKPLDLDARELGAGVGVPFDIDTNPVAYSSVVDRFAHWSSREAREVREDVELWDVDVARLRAAKDIVLADSIPLNAAAVMLASARMMFRSAATAAMTQPRANISSFSKVGDSLASMVRMGHTERGSYIVPILVPVGVPDTRDVDDSPPLAGLEIADEVESAERRMTRTFAEAFTALHAQVVVPEQMPTTDSILEMVTAGVTREFVSAVSRVLDESAISSLDARFRWASSQQPPAVGESRVLIPNDASEKLEATARRMAKVKAPSHEFLSGPVVSIQREPNDPNLEFAIRASRRGRMVKVYATARAERLPEVTRWMNQRTTIAIAGKVESTSNRVLIRNLESMGPLELWSVSDSDQPRAE